MKILVWLAAGLITASVGLGAEIYGTITDNGKPVPKATAVKLDCSGAAVSGVTDEFGSYRLKSAAAGDCRLTLTYKGSSPSLPVTLYEKPARYDLVVRDEAGKLALARK
jgi:hypothetical protein